MAIFSGPEIPNNGLVFHYDMSNTVKSWKGAPTTNVYPNPVVENGVSNFSLVSSSEIAPDNTPTARSWTCPNIGSQSQFWSPYITSTSMFTYSVWLKASSPVTVGLYPQGTYESERVEVTVTTSWQRFSVSRTASASATVGGLVRIFGGSAFSGILYIWGHQLEANSFATPFVTGTRSNTQSILDLTNNNTVTASSLTYASDGTFSFASPSNFASVAYNAALDLVNTVTLEAWLKYTTSANTAVIEKSNSNTHYQFQIFNSGQGTGLGGELVFMLQPVPNNWVVAGIANNDGQWHHVVGTYDRSTTTARIYVDGILRNTNSAIATGPTTNTQPLLIGSRSGGSGFSGTIPVAKVYNRVLSAAEIQQNFEATRGRYSI
jgi:hypothetical protein